MKFTFYFFYLSNFLSCYFLLYLSNFAKKYFFLLLEYKNLGLLLLLLK